MDATSLSFMYILLTAIIGVFAALVLFKLFKADLASLVMESDGKKASLSRFQALIFTFVVAGLFLVLSIEHGAFVEVPNGVLGLLGISVGGYAVSKGIQNGKGKDGKNADNKPSEDKTV